MGSRHRTRGATKASCASVPAPTISLERLRANDRGALRALRDALVVAPGFFNLDASNALPPALVRECYEVARAFFALPLDAKAAYVHTQYDRETGGYVPLLEEYAYQPNTAAMVESFDACRDLPLSHPALHDDDDAVGVGPVDWPAEAPGMKTAFAAFYDAADDVARDLFRALARVCVMKDEDGDEEEDEDEEAAAASELARHFLENFGPTSHCSFRALRYPGAADAEVASIARGMGTDDDGAKKTKKRRRISSDEYRSITPVGIAEHTDFEAFTLLHQTRPGLELKDLAGTWRDASCAPESSTFTVIIADVMERWTGGLLTATPHRVAFTPHERLSLVRFNGLDPGTVVETLPAFRGRPSPTHRAATTTQGEHVGRMVTAAAKNLEDMLETYPKRALTTNPRRFAQLIVTRGREVLLGKHASGEFEGRWTGFIEEVKPRETPARAALRAVARGNLRWNLRWAAAAGLTRDAVMEALESNTHERARLRFRGWHDGLVIEHEFTLDLDGADGASLIPEDDDDDESDESDAPARMRPRWFDEGEIPYDEMPEDDRHWYPRALALARECGGGNAAAGTKPGWRELIVGEFRFGGDDARLVSKTLERIATDA